jgi:4-hydroxy-4-methyl-2-oxoglutarate aldolase
MSATLPPVDELRRLLYTPVLSDVLDSFGLMRQALRPFVRPLDETLVLLGRVRTGRYEWPLLQSPVAILTHSRWT